ncbi:MAG: alginate export family protein [Saprospiraceae bacterium]|jgi:hypothetical protein
MIFIQKNSLRNCSFIIKNRQSIQLRWKFTFIGICIAFLLWGQSNDPDAYLTLGIEYRPRTELRYGYRKLPTVNAQPAFFTSHRARLNLGYESEKINFFLSVQDIRLWGEEATRDRLGELQLFEFYVMPQLNDHWSMKIGRQRLSFDDERFFAQNDWRQASGKHDGINIIYRSPSIQFDWFTAFNQSTMGNFGTNYQPGFEGYKFLMAHLMTWDINSKSTLTSTIFADGYQGTTPVQKTFVKSTIGLKFKQAMGSKTSFAASLFSQNGKLPSGQKIRAWFYDIELLQPISPNYQLRAGLQYFSGGNSPTDDFSNSFLAQYGAFHKFNGRMDYTAKTVDTYNHESLSNPYIIQDLQLNDRVKLSFETHLLGTQNYFYALENDLRCLWKVNAWTQLEIAYMNLSSNEKINQLPTGNPSNGRKMGHFFYVQALWKNPVRKIINLF